jgi:hypothetical protein
MTWYCCYLWAINNNTLFVDEAYITDADGFEDLVHDARVQFEVDEDVDDFEEDYEVDVLDWSIGD